MSFDVFLVIIGLFLGQGVTYQVHPSFIAFFAILFLFIACSLSFWPLSKSTGLKKSSVLFLTLSLFAIGFETFALQTGIPYGSFHYTGLIGTSLPGGAAWTIPLGWVPLVLTSFSIGQKYPRPWNFVIGLLILCLCDLLLDPVATALGYWQWQTATFSYYGVPLQNFFGWLISGGTGIAITTFFIHRKQNHSIPSTVHRGSLLLLSFHLGAAIRLGQIFPALTGCALVLILFLSKTSQKKK